MKALVSWSQPKARRNTTECTGGYMSGGKRMWQTKDNIDKTGMYLSIQADVHGIKESGAGQVIME